MPVATIHFIDTSNGNSDCKHNLYCRPIQKGNISKEDATKIMAYNAMAQMLYD